MSGKTCRGKRRYRDEDQAGDALRSIRYHSDGKGKIATRAYFCNRCKGFHLTSQERRS